MTSTMEDLNEGGAGFLFRVDYRTVNGRGRDLQSYGVNVLVRAPDAESIGRRITDLYQYRRWLEPAHRIVVERAERAFDDEERLYAQA